MKIMLIVDFITLISIFIAAYIGYWFGIDMDTFLTLGCGAFSLEMVISAWIKVSENKETTDDKKTTTQTGAKKANG